MKFAAYDKAAIYAIGDSPAAAIAKAREDAREPEAEFFTAEISDDDAREIEEIGFDANLDSFTVDKLGRIRPELRKFKEAQ